MPANLATLESGADRVGRLVRDFLLDSVSFYPAIGDWWDHKVVPGIQSGQRVCHAAIADGQCVAVCVGKRARPSGKLCTLRVKKDYRRLGIGQQLLQATLKDLVAFPCERIHFTISEETMGQCGSFFPPYGFQMVSWTSGRYVKGMDELVFTADSRQIVRSLRCRQPIAGNSETVLISIKPRYAQMIEKGLKRVEFRRRFSTRLSSARMIGYVSAPVKEVRFTGTIVNVVRSAPDLLWERFKEQGGVDRESFETYFSGASTGYALSLEDVKPLPMPLPLGSRCLRRSGFRPPQSFAILKHNSPVLHVVPQFSRGG